MWARSFDTSGGLFDFNGRASGLPAVAGAVADRPEAPITYDLRLVAPSTLRIENDQARIVASGQVN